MRSRPAIVVIGFDRPKSIRRLLTYLDLANYPKDPVTLVISLDYSESDPGQATRAIAEQFEWRHGPKRVLLQPEFLGLRSHVLLCGGLSQEYESIIVLEDDLSVSTEFYQYAVEALDFSKAHEAIAGVALYSEASNKTSHLPFIPLHDGFDNFYLQVAASWGQAWTASQWRGFRTWYDSLPQRDSQAWKRVPDSAPVPRRVARFSEFSWLKYFIWYLMESGKVFHYPRISYSTNHADRGTHSPVSSKAWHVPLAIQSKPPRFSTPEESLAVYDAFMEIWPDRLRRIYPSFDGFDFDVDLYGTKQRSLLQSPYVLTSRKVSGGTEMSFDIERKPLEANFLVTGDQTNSHCISLVRSDQVLSESTMLISNLETVRYFFNCLPIRDVVRNSFKYYWQRKKRHKT